MTRPRKRLHSIADLEAMLPNADELGRKALLQRIRYRRNEQFRLKEINRRRVNWGAPVVASLDQARRMIP